MTKKTACVSSFGFGHSGFFAAISPNLRKPGAYNTPMQAWRVYAREHPQFGPWYQRAESKPGWVWKAALTAVVLVIVVPLVLLVLAALAVGAIVFVLMSLIAAAVGLFTGRVTIQGTQVWRTPDAPAGPGSGGGRENVRVIDPDRM